MSDGRRPARELEATLAVVGPDSEAVAAAVAGLGELAGRRLGPARQVRLRDAYLDLPGEPLLRQGRAFRLRREDGRAVVGLKGAGATAEGGLVEREEREAPWGTEAVGVLRRVLAGRGPGDAVDREGLEAAARAAGDPLPALQDAGFHVLQDRTTRRTRRDILEAGRPVGELAVDEVRFDAAGRPCVHREVEVEAADPGPEGRRLLREAVAELRDRFGDALRAWIPSKLATGLALSELLSEDASPAWLAPDGSLAPDGYDRVASLLEAGPGRGR